MGFLIQNGLKYQKKVPMLSVSDEYVHGVVQWRSVYVRLFLKSWFDVYFYFLLFFFFFVRWYGEGMGTQILASKLSAIESKWLLKTFFQIPTSASESPD